MIRPRAPLLAVALAVAAGVLAGRGLAVEPAAVVLLGLAAAVAAMAAPRAAAPVALLAVGALAAARAGPSPPEPPRTGRFEACLGRIALTPDGHVWSGEAVVREVAVAHAWRATILLPASPRSEVPRAGDRVRLRGSVRAPPPPLNPGESDRALAAALDGRAGEVRAREGWLVVGSCGASPFGPARDALATRIREELPPREAALADALALGDPSGLDPEDAESFRTTGTLHLLSIAGVNLGIVAGAVGFLLGEALLLAAPTWCRRHDRRLALAITAFAVAGAWALFAGGRLPAARALIAIAAGALALGIGARRAGWNAFGAAIAAILLAVPGAIDGAGFQLGAAAVAGILATSRPGIPPETLRAWLVAKTASLARMTAAAAVATAPLLAWRYGSVPVLGAAANLPALPLLGAGALLPLAASVPLGLLSDGAARIAIRCAHPALAAAPALVGWFAALPLARVRLFVPLLAAAGAALAMGALVLMTGRARAAAVAIGVAVALVAAWLGTRPPDRMTVTFLAVGQGDATVVRFADGTTMLVDGGPPGAGTRVVVPFLRSQGVRRIDWMVVSHAHPDHTGGLPAVADAFPVGELWLAGPACGEANLMALVERLVAARTPIHVVGVGSPGRIAGGARISIVGGVADDGPEARKDRGRRNDRSLGLRLSEGSWSVLLTGDVERNGERALLEGGAPLGSSVAKVPHHGSPTSSGPALVSAVRPAIAVIPVGADNPFGFPNAAVVARWEAAGARVYRTDRDGAVTVARCPGNGPETAICARSFVDGDSSVAVP